jgi:hypothetical protein
MVKFLPKINPIDWKKVAIAVEATVSGYLEIVKLVIGNVELGKIAEEAYENSYFSILELVVNMSDWEYVASEVTIRRP